MQTNNQHDDDDGSSAAAVLPDDMLANVFGRLPPSSLAASRCVRKHWCSIIDARRLLRVDLLPLQLDAFFCNPSDLEARPSFFAPPSTTRRITTGRLDFSDTLKELPYMEIEDQCNGLLLLSWMVVNPATRQCASLPAFGDGQEVSMAYGGGTTIPMMPAFYLVYDPMVSPQHFEVFLIPSFYTTSNDDGLVKPNYVEQHHLDLEWPPSPYTTHVFSSRTWRWEERSFVRQGEVAAGTIADMMPSHHGQGSRQAVYFRGALYVHCQNDSVMRIALSDDKYQMIKPPAAGTKLGERRQSYLGKSKKGVYSVLIIQRNGAGSFPHCRVWLLNERCGHMEWLLKSKISLLENIPLHFDANKYSEPWTVDYEEKKAPAAQDEINEWDFYDNEWDFYDGIVDYEEKKAPAAQDGPSEWDFYDGIVGYEEKKAPAAQGGLFGWQYAMVFLGFHPSKEIAFFCISACKSRAVSYHLNTSKVEELGPLYVTKLESSFPYTACWMGELFGNNS